MIDDENWVMKLADFGAGMLFEENQNFSDW